MSVGEASHARGRVLLVGYDGVEVVVISGWLRENLMELFSSCLYVGDVG